MHKRIQDEHPSLYQACTYGAWTNILSLRRTPPNVTYNKRTKAQLCVGKNMWGTPACGFKTYTMQQACHHMVFTARNHSMLLPFNVSTLMTLYFCCECKWWDEIYCGEWWCMLGWRQHLGSFIRCANLMCKGVPIVLSTLKVPSEQLIPCKCKRQ